jgi:hypothetical protein
MSQAEELTVMGEKAGSINEYNVYQALHLAGVRDDELIYQYAIDGGRFVRGGQVIDFVVKRPPQWTAVYVQGTRWHTGQRGIEESLKQVRAKKHGMRIVEIWEEECMSIEAALTIIKTRVL